MAERTGKRLAIIGGGVMGLLTAYYEIAGRGPGAAAGARAVRAAPRFEMRPMFRDALKGRDAGFAGLWDA